jgi:hypothetical protein
MGPAMETCPCPVIGLAFEPSVDPNVSERRGGGGMPTVVAPKNIIMDF